MARLISTRLGKGLSSGLLFSLLGAVMVTSCASSYESSSAPRDMAGSAMNNAIEADIVAQSAPALPTDGAVQEKSAESLPVEPAPGSPSQSKPQLIKTADLSMEVEDTSTAIQAISQLMGQEQGDILNLNESGSSDARQSANLSLRVPATRLNATLEKLAALGEVENRSISAQDVSGQIVDTDARLRNLRKQEEMLLKIMEKSGEVPDVLAVSQELANVRQNIEQIDAQLKLLKSQVAYSTINIYLSEPATFSAPSRTKFSTELKNTWEESTDSVLGFSRGLIKLGLALLVWSPYLGILALLIWGAKRSLRNRRDRRIARKQAAMQQAAMQQATQPSPTAPSETQS